MCSGWLPGGVLGTTTIGFVCGWLCGLGLDVSILTETLFFKRDLLSFHLFLLDSNIILIWCPTQGKVEPTYFQPGDPVWVDGRFPAKVEMADGDRAFVAYELLGSLNHDKFWLRRLKSQESRERKFRIWKHRILNLWMFSIAPRRTLGLENESLQREVLTRQLMLRADAIKDVPSWLGPHLGGVIEGEEFPNLKWLPEVGRVFFSIWKDLSFFFLNVSCVLFQHEFLRFSWLRDLSYHWRPEAENMKSNLPQTRHGEIQETFTLWTFFSCQGSVRADCSKHWTACRLSC